MIVKQDTRQALNPQQMVVARRAMSLEGQLDGVAAELGYANGNEALAAVSAAMGLEFAELGQFEVDRQLLEFFPPKLIHRHRIFPLGREDGAFVIATSNPFDVHAFDAVSAAISCCVTPVIAPVDELSKLIKTHLGVGAETIDGLLAQRDEDGVELLDDVDFDGSEASEMAQEASVVRLVNEIITEAAQSRASDIHLEAHESGIKIRYRIDGALQRQPAPPEINRFQAAIISRLKIMAKLNIAEKRVPQDGRIKLRVSGHEVDIRISVIPMLYGEGVVMRVLDRENMRFSLRQIGMPSSIHKNFQELIRLPHGILLVTGPTGSGKTTTLYSALNEIKSEETKIITTEDPIEYQLEGINQIQVNAKVGLTFAASLRSVLRHDPDVVLVGEIRDLETAENATQASLTGHLVFSTLHTNNSASAFMRLCDMGIEPFLVSSTVEGVLAQRLVRVLCRECREPYRPLQDELPADICDRLSHDQTIYRAVGCRECRGTGYAGRTGLYELLAVTDETRHLANERAPTTAIERAAQKAGMRTLRDDGLDKVIDGQTSLDEVMRVTKTS